LLSVCLQNPWVRGGFALILVLLALSTFGLYEFQLPAALQQRLAGISGRMRGGRALGVFLMGVLSGHREILQPLAGLRGTAQASAAHELPFLPVRSVADLEAQLQAARGRPVMLDFWAEWCVSCEEMEQFTFSDARVQARLKDTLLLRADITANNADDQALLRRFNLFGPPGIVFFDRGGRGVAFRVIGFQPPACVARSRRRTAGGTLVSCPTNICALAAPYRAAGKARWPQRGMRPDTAQPERLRACGALGARPDHTRSSPHASPRVQILAGQDTS
jgi:thiol:disulfide interchange protein